MDSIASQILHDEQRAGEQRLARARLAVLAFCFCINFIYLIFVPEREFDTHLRTAAAFGLGLLYSLLWLIYIHTITYRRYHRYASSAIDFTFIVGFNILWSMYSGHKDLSAQLKLTSGYVALLVLIVLTGVRFDYRTVRFVTVLSAIFYGLYIYYGSKLENHTLTLDWDSSIEQPRVFSTIDLFARWLGLVVAGSLMSFILRRVDRLLQKSVFESVKNQQLKQYVSHSVAGEIEAGRGNLDLAGKRKRVAVLFCDIQGFTALSEELSPEDLLTMLNRYYEVMVDVIFRHEGTLDKYIGDGVMALFGAPRDLENPSLSAISCAIAMLQALNELNAKYAYNLSIGVGIHVDQVVVGNLGTEVYKNYTAVGRGVNIASRIETLTREAAQPILFSEAVAEDIKDYIVPQPAGRYPLKGISESFALYTIDPDRLASLFRKK